MVPGDGQNVWHRAYVEDVVATLLGDRTAALDDFMRGLPDAYAAVLANGEGSDVRPDLPTPARKGRESHTDGGAVSSDD